MAKRSGKSDELRKLFATPPKEFTAARNALAAELKKSGDADAAKQVKALKRPDAAAFLVNAVAQKYPGDVKAMVDTADKVSKAQRGGHGSEMQALSKELRSLSSSLVERAEEIAKDAGVKFTTALRGKVETTFRSANQDDYAREKVMNGILEHELSASGFEGLFEAGGIHGKAREKAPRAETAKKAKGPSAADRHAAEKAAHDLKAAQAEFARAQEEQSDVEERAEKIQKELNAAQTRYERAEKHLREAKERAEKAREKLGD
ncbi:MAG: hypothetical protein ACJ790_08965 [Myxococcaceae bacterium]